MAIHIYIYIYIYSIYIKYIYIYIAFCLCLFVYKLSNIQVNLKSDGSTLQTDFDIEDVKMLFSGRTLG